MPESTFRALNPRCAVSRHRRRLTAGFNLGRDQAYFIDARSMRDVDDLGHVIEGQVGISP